MVVRVDYENNAVEFWAALTEAVVGRAGEPYATGRRLLSQDEVKIENTDEAQEFVDLVTSLTGWDDPEAPKYAPHPLLLISEG